MICGNIYIVQSYTIQGHSLNCVHFLDYKKVFKKPTKNQLIVDILDYPSAGRAFVIR